MSSSVVRDRARAALEQARGKQDRLAQVDPFLIDISLHENPVGSRVGQTLEDKLEILPLLRDFGFRNIALGRLNQAMPDVPDIDDDFMSCLQQIGTDLRGCYAFTSPGIIDAQDIFRPDPSLQKLRNYGVPNTVLEIHVSPLGREGKYTLDELRRSLAENVLWIMENVKGEAGASPRIFVNLVDGFDALMEVPEDTFGILDQLVALPIEGILMEDARGTYMPFQVGACIEAVRAFVPPPMKLLVHAHAGAGFENASLIEALLHGADGVWGGFSRQDGASLGELLANLARVGNVHVEQAYRLRRLLPLSATLQAFDDETTVPDDVPVLGHNAYRLVHGAYRQRDGRFMDLPPERIGGRYRYRISAVVSDAEAVRGRLAEVTGRMPEEFGDPVVESMIFLMRRELRSGLRIDYDDPANLVPLYERARDRMRRTYPQAVERT